jgi:hypothetical protein
MAYVAISNNLINSTKNNINKMRDKEKAALTVPPDRITVPNTDSNLELLVWGNHLHLRDQMPSEWKKEYQRVNARIFYESAEGKNTVFEFSFETTDPIEVPQSTGNSYYGHNVIVPETSYLLPAQALAALEHHKLCHQIDAKWDIVRDQVSQFLESAKSLNEALKLWPALSLYISDGYISRVNNNAKREKTASKAEEIMASISIDQLTATAVASKLTV